MIEKPDLLIITGPTASGKTGLSIKLARLLDAEIISADSMQIYKYMNIGTDKVSEDIQKEIPHHLIDICNPNEEFSVAKYKKLADRKISEITQRGKLPILVGGTTMYIKAVVEGFMLPYLPDSDFRKKYKKELKTIDKIKLHNYLKMIDPEYAERIHPNDTRRVTRAIEIFHMTGRTRSYFEFKQNRKESRYNFLQFAIKRKRKSLYHKINNRVDQMLSKGLIEEVQYLFNNYSPGRTASQALGYKEIKAYLDGKIDKETAVRNIKQGSRHLAKRQLTFLRRNPKNIWLNPDYWYEKDLLTYIIKSACSKFDYFERCESKWNLSLLKCMD
ncbi:MAG: tRNA (adenosine(37)-N6)-dimethylallyltransferase MiaA [Bacillota bacterium]